MIKESNPKYCTTYIGIKRPSAFPLFKVFLKNVNMEKESFQNNCHYKKRAFERFHDLWNILRKIVTWKENISTDVLLNELANFI